MTQEHRGNMKREERQKSIHAVHAARKPQPSSSQHAENIGADAREQTTLRNNHHSKMYSQNKMDYAINVI